MIRRDDVIRLLTSEKDVLLTRWPVTSLALFGSIARGDQHPNSDVDLLVEFHGAIGLEFFDLINELEQLLGSKVDLVPKAGIKPEYWTRIAPEVVEVLHV